MKKILLIISLLVITMLVATEPHFMSYPSISPNGEQVCFVYKNDLWLVPFTGGKTERITSTTAEEWHPKFSPDGKMIAWESMERDGFESDKNNQD